jgi:hypothetical protein
MRRFVEGTDRGQSTLFPECLEDWIDEDVADVARILRRVDAHGLEQRHTIVLARWDYVHMCEDIDGIVLLLAISRLDVQAVAQVAQGRLSKQIAGDMGISEIVSSRSISSNNLALAKKETL